MRTSSETRTEMNRCLSKAIAFHDANRPDLARLWAQQLTTLMAQQFGGSSDPIIHTLFID